MQLLQLLQPGLVVAAWAFAGGAALLSLASRMLAGSGGGTAAAAAAAARPRSKRVVGFKLPDEEI